MSIMKSLTAGKLSGSTTSTEERLAKADAVMAAGHLLKSKTEDLKQANKEVKKSITEAIDLANAVVNDLSAALSPKKAKTKAEQQQLDLVPGDVKALKGMIGKPKKVVSIQGLSLPEVSADFMKEREPSEKVKGEIFTILPSENALIDHIRTRAAAKNVFANRSAVVRAAITAMSSLDDKQVLSALGRIRVVKPGRSD